MFFDRRRCAKGTRSVKYSIYFRDGQRKPEQSLISTGILLHEDDVKFLESHKKAVLKSVERRKAVPHIEDPEQRLIWQMLYEESYDNPDTGEKLPGYLHRANAIIAQLGDDFTFEAFKKALTAYGDICSASTSSNINIENDTSASDLVTASDQNYNFTEVGKAAISNDKACSTSYSQSTTQNSSADARQNDVIQALVTYQQLMYQEERFGTGNSYRDAANSLSRFHQKLVSEFPEIYADCDEPKLTFQKVTVEFLNNYERWMYKGGKKPQSDWKTISPASPSTIGIYLRNVRHVFNRAIKSHIVSRNDYPFGKDGYIIPNGRNIKKAISIEQIEWIMTHQCNSDAEQQSRDMWLFSYIANGANFADILRLRWGRLGEGDFNFIRKKIKNTAKKNLSPVKVYMNDLGWEIIDRWGNKKRNDNNFVFPFLDESMTELQAHNATKQFIRTTNKYMRRIARRLRIKSNLTTYVARHSFSSIMRRSGADLVMISKMLAHASLTTTQNYFDDFEEEKNRAAVLALLPQKFKGGKDLPPNA